MLQLGIALVLALSPLTVGQVDHPAPAQGRPAAPRKVVPATPLEKPQAQPEQATPVKRVRTVIYDEKADARRQIAAAMTSAGRENRRVLIQWGGNWCGWCHLLHDTFKTDPAIAKELLYEYDLVLVDAGQPQGKNLDLARTYGADLEKFGYPYLTILDPAGNVIANQETGALEKKSPEGEAATPPGHDAAKVLEFLKAHEAKPVEAGVVLKQARSAAKSAGKKVFVHFGAPTCGWCKKLEAWLVREDVAPLMGKDFVDVKIDIERMTGAGEFFARYNKNSAKSGIPWLVIVDAQSADPVISGEGPKGNIGFPSSDEEIAHFVTMLKTAAVKMSDSDIQALKATLLEGRKN